MRSGPESGTLSGASTADRGHNYRQRHSAGRSLSVSGLFVNGSQLVVAGSSLVAGRGGPSWGQGGAARASRDDDLDAAEGCRRLKQRRGSLVTAAASPLIRCGLKWTAGAWRAGVQPYLGARTRSGDMMGDRVPATGGRGRSFYGGRPRPAWRQEHQGAGHTTSTIQAPERARWPTSSGGGWELGGDQRLVAELAQGVVGLAGELASHR